MIQEIKEDLEDKILTQDDEVYVLRQSKTIDGTYRPIIDWDYIENVYEDDEDYTPEELQMFEDRHSVFVRANEKMKVYEFMAEMLVWDHI